MTDFTSKTEVEARILSAVAERMEIENRDIEATSKLWIQLAPQLVATFCKVMEKACIVLEHSDARNQEMHDMQKEQFSRHPKSRSPLDELRDSGNVTDVVYRGKGHKS